jgi:hypothetical protein
MRSVRFLIAGTIAAFAISRAMGADDVALLRQAQRIFRPLTAGIRAAAAAFPPARGPEARLMSAGIRHYAGSGVFGGTV